MSDSGSFTLKIQLGNEAMQTPEDLARAVRRVVLALAQGNAAGKVGDDNGNSVGTWRLEYDD